MGIHWLRTFTPKGEGSYLLPDWKEEIQLNEQEVEYPIHGCRNKVQCNQNVFARISVFM